ncbi:MAG: hypothetical protein FD181_602 [Prolixibacteraceae bacterium]|nr:MAG: hypothetical protein FD181_602 [Prolixibacteraceae bacterium]
MVKFIRIILVVVITAVIFFSCGDLNRKVDDKIDKLMKKAESLDSLINKDVDKVLQLDSLINTGSEKAKKLDSLINKSTSRLDSIVNKVINPAN